MNKQLAKKKKKKNGFTLIELIVVISILGILAAIAVPRVAGFTTQAQQSADEATARTIASGITMYEAQNGAITAINDTVLAELNKSVSNITLAAAPATPSTWGVTFTAASGGNPAYITVTSPDGSYSVDY